jgi:hypothetical protein
MVLKSLGARSTSTAIHIFPPSWKTKNEVDRFKNIPYAREPFERLYALTSSDIYSELLRGFLLKICARTRVKGPNPSIKNKLIQTCQRITSVWTVVCAFVIGAFVLLGILFGTPTRMPTHPSKQNCLSRLVTSHKRVTTRQKTTIRNSVFKRSIKKKDPDFGKEF